MTVTTPVSLSKIKAEFGGPNNLSAYVRGGSYVPNTAANAAISTTAAGLKLSQFAGAQAYTPISGVTITPASPSGTTIRAEPAPATATVNSQSVTVTWSGGNPGATVTWSRVSGDTLPTVPSGATGTFGATVNKNSTKSAVYRATVSDGVSSASKDCPVSLEYTTNL